MGVNGETLYIKISRNTVSSDRNIKIGDIAKLSCANESVTRRIKQKKLYTFADGAKEKKDNIKVFSALKVIELILEEYPSLTVSNEGEKDFIVEYMPRGSEGRVITFLKTALLCIVIFFGASFTIMAFNNDVSVGDVFAKLYVQMTGNASDGVTELEICYSLGLAFGIIIFFNHIGRKKITHDPTPIQVEMRKYEKDVDTTFIENAGRKGHDIDVG